MGGRAAIRVTATLLQERLGGGRYHLPRVCPMRQRLPREHAVGATAAAVPRREKRISGDSAVRRFPGNRAPRLRREGTTRYCRILGRRRTGSRPPVGAGRPAPVRLRHVAVGALPGPTPHEGAPVADRRALERAIGRPPPSDRLAVVSPRRLWPRNSAFCHRPESVSAGLKPGWPYAACGVRSCLRWDRMLDVLKPARNAGLAVSDQESIR